MALVQYERKGDVVVITLDDGKMNSFTFSLIEALHGALDKAEKEDGSVSVLLMGNAKAFSAGFDLGIMGGPQSMEQYNLFMRGCELSIRLAEFPRPVAMGSTGHGLALGAIILLAGDVRVGKRGPKFKYGMNEVAIGMSVPILGVELARAKMPKAYISRAVTQGCIFTADEAVQAGFLDICVDAADFEATCMAEAGRLAKLKNPGFSTTKKYERQAMMKIIKDTLLEDGNRLKPPEAKL